MQTTRSHCVSKHGPSLLSLFGSSQLAFSLPAFFLPKLGNWIGKELRSAEDLLNLRWFLGLL